MMVVMSVLVFLMWGSLTSIDPSYLMASEADDEEIFSLVGPVLGTLVFAGLMYWFALRKGAGLYLEFFKASTLQDPLPEPGGHGGAVQEGST